MEWRQPQGRPALAILRVWAILDADVRLVAAPLPHLLLPGPEILVTFFEEGSTLAVALVRRLGVDNRQVFDRAAGVTGAFAAD